MDVSASFFLANLSKSLSAFLTTLVNILAIRTKNEARFRLADDCLDIFAKWLASEQT